MTETMRTSIHLILLVFLSSFSGPVAAAGGTPLLPYQSPGRSLGVVSCASELCHGAVVRWKQSNILQNEYVTWSRVDKHATRAFQVLASERSKRIVANLGLAGPATGEKLCLDCHAFAPPTARRGERFRVEDGVSCEACHGPAEGWIAPHVEPGATHAGNVEHGLYPLEDPVAQARLCLSCHFGNRDHFVTHRMMGAGHPRMSFELDTFAATEPAHYVIDSDWHARKGDWDTVRTWAIGQALAASELLDLVLDPKRNHDGLFPELVAFDCHACHHPMTELRWSPRTGTSPGHIRLNDANLLMLRAIVRRALPAPQAADYERRLAELSRAMAGDGGDAMEAARALRSTLDGVTASLAQHAFRPDDLRAMLGEMLDDGLDGRYQDYSDAEQATMAIAGLLDYLARHRTLPRVGEANAALDRVYAAVRDDSKFHPEQYREALRGLRDTVMRP